MEEEYQPSNEALSVLADWFRIEDINLDNEVLSFTNVTDSERLEYDVTNQMPLDDFADFANLIEVNFRPGEKNCYDCLSFTSFVADKTGISTLREQLEKL